VVAPCSTGGRDRRSAEGVACSRCGPGKSSIGAAPSSCASA
jgi:hypothetical protein